MGAKTVKHCMPHISGNCILVQSAKGKEGPYILIIPTILELDTLTEMCLVMNYTKVLMN